MRRQNPESPAIAVRSNSGFGCGIVEGPGAFPTQSNYGIEYHWRFAIRHVALFTGLCLISIASADPRQLSLSEYIDRVLADSDQSQDLRDDLYSSQLAIELAELDFTTRVVPLASLNVGDDVGRQVAGIEAKRANEFGTAISVGVQSSKVSSNNVEIFDPYNSKVFVRLSQGLFRRWGNKYNRYSLTTAEIDQRSQMLEAVRRRQELVLDAIRHYYSAVLSALLLEQGERSSERAAEHRDAATSRQRVGLVSKTDVYRAELAFLGAQNIVDERKRALRRNIESLHELASIPGRDLLRPESTIQRMTPLIPEAWKKQLLENRSDWQAYLLDRDRARLTTFRTKQNVDPDVSMSLTVEREGFGDSYDESVELDETSWALLLDVRTTFDRSEEKNALARQRLQVNRLARRGEALKRKIFRQVRESLEELEAQDVRHSFAVETARRAKLGLELSVLRYTKGMSSNLEVLDAETAFSNAELDELRSLVEYNLGVARLGLSLGVLEPDWVSSLFLPLQPEPAGE